MKFEFSDSVRTVSEITVDIKLLLEGNYRFVAVSGEVSNLRTPYSGHHYFTLKDETAQLRAVMFKGQQRYLDQPLRDGQQLICRGRISVYEPRGDYQLIVDTVDQHGVGMLQLQFAALKKRLGEEGLFDTDCKQTIPSFPDRIVVITSATGAALQDFLKVWKYRKSSSSIAIYPVMVQGDKASHEIAKAIEKINQQLECDLIVLCRGGGSLEDLWAFNEERVARAVFGSKLPIVTGIGHETDTTLADLCADLRGPTPTGAAEIVIPDNRKLAVSVTQFKGRLANQIENQINYYETIISHQTRLLSGFKNSVESLSLRLDMIAERFFQSFSSGVSQKEKNLQQLVTSLKSQAPLTKITLRQQQVAHLKKNLEMHINAMLLQKEEKLARVSGLMQGVSPLSTLARGYSVVRKHNDQTGEMDIVADSKQVKKGDQVNVLLGKGELDCEVVKTT